MAKWVHLSPRFISENQHHDGKGKNTRSHRCCFGNSQNVGAQVFPETIPDLFVNGPIVISGKYSGQMPPQLMLTGKMGNGQMLNMPVRVDTSEVVPIQKVMIKQRMDDLVARYWMTGDEGIKKEAVELSVEETFPSPYTSMVAYEMTPKEKEKADKEEKKDKKQNKKKKKKGMSKGQIAALTGGAVIVGAGVFLLGAVALTNSNVNVLDAVSSGMSGIGNVGGMLGSVDCPCDGIVDAISCGNCDCGGLASMFSCGACPDCDGCLDAIPCGDCDGGCIELPGCSCFSGICDSCGGIMGGCCDTIGDGCGSICGLCSCFGSLGGMCGDLCGNIGGFCGGITGFCGDICGNIGGLCGGITDICGNIGSCFGSCGDVCGDICGGITGVVDDVL